MRRTIAENKNVNVPVEITRWLGRKSFEEGDFAAAERYLLPVLKDSKNADPAVLDRAGGGADPAWQDARGGARRRSVSGSRPGTLQSLPAACRHRRLSSLGKKEFDEAAKLCDESLLLQPEGRLNAEGRLLSGEISFARGDYDGAARAFMTVAVLYDDSSVTPRALQRAADAYRKANNEPEAEKALQELQQRFPDSVKSPKDLQRELMKHLLFLVLTAASPSASSPPSKNMRCPRSKGRCFLPDGWFMKEESEDGVTVYQISREKAENEEDVFSAGLILSVTTKVPDRASMKPSEYAQRSSYVGPG